MRPLAERGRIGAWISRRWGRCPCSVLRRGSPAGRLGEPGGLLVVRGPQLLVTRRPGVARRGRAREQGLDGVEVRVPAGPDLDRLLQRGAAVVEREQRPVAVGPQLEADHRLAVARPRLLEEPRWLEGAHDAFVLVVAVPVERDPAADV